MCGIVGVLGPGAGSVEGLNVLRQMIDAIKHRGPDDDGAWADSLGSAALGHCRLSILDLSQDGHQPMACACGRHVISFNGEIYNYQALALDLEQGGIRFRGHSDTEALIEAICAWGIEETLERIEGMFAFAHWDRDERAMHLVRDRAGIKPLYYGMANGSFLFASELKALELYPGFQAKINREALELYFRLSFVPPPLSIYQGISKLLPGTFIRVHEASGSLQISEPQAYWSLREVVKAGSENPLDLPDEAATDRLEQLMQDSVRSQKIADVPLGAFLSGGVDSSAVVAIMQAISPEPIHTFAIGFEEEGFDEAPFAKAIAKHLGTHHTEFYVTSENSRDVLQRLGTLYDEPFAEPSQIPMVMLAELARKHVTVVLTGDGGDELFGGYKWYGRLRQLAYVNQLLPLSWRRQLAGALRHIARDESAVQRLTSGWPRFKQQMATKPHKMIEALLAERPAELYYNLRSDSPGSDGLVIDAPDNAKRWVIDHGDDLPFDEVRLVAMYLDSMMFLPEHPLTKVDRATMASSLEARVPLLDRDIIEFAWRLPLQQKIRGSTTKFLLRQVLYRYVPPQLIERPKGVFAVPVRDWLRGPLREWTASLLDTDLIKSQGYLNPELVQRTFREHMNGSRDHKGTLWSLLIFQSWLANHKHSG